jgi:hypothetical protein
MCAFLSFLSAKKILAQKKPSIGPAFLIFVYGLRFTRQIPLQPGQPMTAKQEEEK